MNTLSKRAYGPEIRIAGNTVVSSNILKNSRETLTTIES